MHTCGAALVGVITKKLIITARYKKENIID